jgi:hypothetical protein
VYDTDAASNKTSTNITIYESAEIVLTNIPINFSLVGPGSEVNATVNKGWPLNISVGGNVPLDLYQNGTDLFGQANPSVAINVENITWNQTESGIFNSLEHLFRWVAEKSPQEYQEIYYRILVPNVMQQKYNGTVNIKGEYSG